MSQCGRASLLTLLLCCAATASSTATALSSGDASAAAQAIASSGASTDAGSANAQAAASAYSSGTSHAEPRSAMLPCLPATHARIRQWRIAPAAGPALNVLVNQHPEACLHPDTVQALSAGNQHLTAAVLPETDALPDALCSAAGDQTAAGAFAAAYANALAQAADAEIDAAAQTIAQAATSKSLWQPRNLSAC